LLTVTAFNQEGTTLNYTFVDGNIDDIFAIGMNSGVISLNGQLNSSYIPNYLLTVQAMDATGFPPTPLSALVVVNITVFAQNLFVPQFTGLNSGAGYEVVILENTTVGTELIVVSAYDQDVSVENRVVTFHFAAYSLFQDIFSLSEAGVVTLIAPLDSSIMTEPMTLVVEARDGGSPYNVNTTFVNVTAIAIYTPPLFSSETYTALFSRMTLSARSSVM